MRFTICYGALIIGAVIISCFLTKEQGAIFAAGMVYGLIMTLVLLMPLDTPKAGKGEKTALK